MMYTIDNNISMLDHFKSEADSLDPETIAAYIEKNYIYVNAHGKKKRTLSDPSYFSYISKTDAIPFLQKKCDWTATLKDVDANYIMVMKMLDNFEFPSAPLQTTAEPEAPRPDYPTIYVSNTHILEHFAPQALNQPTTQDAEYDARHNKQTIIDYIRDNYRVHQVSKTEFYYSAKPNQPNTSKKQSTPYVFYIRLDHERRPQEMHVNKRIRKYLGLTLLKYRAEYLTIYNTDHSIAVRRVDAQKAYNSHYITAKILEKIKQAVKEQINFHQLTESN